MDYADRFLGGRGVAAKIYWDNVKPDISAFDPENMLIFMTGPMGAVGAQGPRDSR
jgi:aldehyde:ferredoxin oxidoreductase